MAAFDEEDEEGEEHYVLEQGSDVESFAVGTPSHAGALGERKGKWNRELAIVVVITFMRLTEL